MTLLKTILRSIAQLLSISLFVLACSVLFEFNLPGHRTFTDDDAIGLAIAYGIVIIVGIGLLINSFYHAFQNHWRTFRITVGIVVLGFGLVTFLPRDVIKWMF